MSELSKFKIPLSSKAIDTVISLPNTTSSTLSPLYLFDIIYFSLAHWSQVKEFEILSRQQF
jgi:hypothetical protein